MFVLRLCCVCVAFVLRLRCVCVAFALRLRCVKRLRSVLAFSGSFHMFAFKSVMHNLRHMFMTR